MNFFEIVSEWSETRTIKGGYMMKENPLCASVLADVADEVFTSRILLYDLAHIMSKPADWGHSGSQRVYTISQIIGSKVQQNVVLAINRGLELMGSSRLLQGVACGKTLARYQDHPVLPLRSRCRGAGKDGYGAFFFDCKEI